MPLGSIAFALSAAVVLEYEDVLKRQGQLGSPPSASAEDIDIVLGALRMMATLTSPRFRFRPFLNDPKDELIIEWALAAGADIIVTDDHHFQHPAVSIFGLTALSAKDYVRQHRLERKLL